MVTLCPMFDGLGSPGRLTHAQIHHGEQDQIPATNFANAGIINGILKSEGTLAELFAYPGAVHGFIGADKDNTNARNLSKGRTLSFFETRL